MRRFLLPLIALAVAAGCSSGGPGDASKPVDPGATRDLPTAASETAVAQ